MKTMHRQSTKDYWEPHAECLAEAWHLHTGPIKRVFCPSPKISLFRAGFVLRCFQHLSLRA